MRSSLQNVSLFLFNLHFVPLWYMLKNFTVATFFVILQVMAYWSFTARPYLQLNKENGSGRDILYGEVQLRFSLHDTI